MREQLPLASVLLDRRLARRCSASSRSCWSRSSLPWVESVRSSVAATRVSLTRVAPCSTARRSGPTRTASRGSSTTSAMPIRPGSRRSARSASSRAAARSVSVRIRGGDRASAGLPRVRQDGRPGAGRLLRNPGPHADARGWGLRLVEFDQTGAPPDEADLVWVESPSNPLLTLPDLDAAVAHPAPTVVDATASTRSTCGRSSGADFVLHSATKFLGGTTTFSSAQSSAGRTTTTSGSRRSAAGSGSSPRRILPRSCHEASRRSKYGWSGTPRTRRRSRVGWMPLQRWSECAIRALEG